MFASRIISIHIRGVPLRFLDFHISFNRETTVGHPIFIYVLSCIYIHINIMYRCTLFNEFQSNRTIRVQPLYDSV